MAAAVALALGALATAPVFAFEFGDEDGFHGTVNTTVTYGVAWRMSSQDPDLIGKAQYNPAISLPPFSLGSQSQRDAIGRFSVNGDDGDLKWEDGDVFTNAVKATVELNLMYGANSGAFFRGYTFYDWENVSRHDLSSLAEKKVGKDAKILDAFLFHNFSVGNKQGSVRLGQQVVSWGESTFIQGGINTINPIDVSKLRVAGAELKEAFLPVNMIWGSFNFTDTLSGEALYMFEFEQTEADPAGTYFSTNDFATLGGTYVMLNFGTVPQPVVNPDFFYPYCYGNSGTDNNIPAQLKPLACGAAVPRARDRYAKDSGQYGFRLNYLADWLNNAEFGFYALNYHSRLPVLSGISVTNTAVSSGRYFAEYPEDIRMYGVSFNMPLEGPGIALQGELSHRPNTPLQIDDVELLFAALSPLNVVIPAPGLRFASQLGNYGPGQEIRGWERHKVSQLQFTATKVFGPGNWFAADQVSLVGEVGFTNVWDLPDPSVLRYQGDGTDTGGGPDVFSGALRNPMTQVDGFPTPFSWGYRIAARADYNNAFGTAYTISPRLAFNHDVNGISPGPGGNFIEDRKSVTIGAEANYLNKLAFDLSYTNFFGAGHLNLISDRDFVAFSVKYSF
ncbi:DUF1302 domain-containing protein [Tahibacter amnicola]|uniref:DUF1302 domain-containing protein n=1 Tax=Tahibacter amnicola TaxID=2976241 RepID=A0ABY6BHM8_9GAMM|nr:DUF1302 domain-containing protein [Tahibacter amnicola]UXI68848.1 DUF1302 domain-containing protein [Tahibacter amnicola]